MIFFLFFFIFSLLFYLFVFGIKIGYFFKIVHFQKKSTEASISTLKKRGLFNTVLASRMTEEPFTVAVGKKRFISGSFVKGKNLHLAVFLPGFFQTRYDMMEMAQIFFERGWNLLFFDFRGSGQSDGVVSSLGGIELKDFAKVMQWGYRRLPQADKIYLVGSALGAIVASVYVPKDMRIDGVILDSLCTSATKWIKHQLKRLPLPQWILDRILLTQIEWVSYFLRYSLSDINPEYSLMRTRIPVLLIHGDEDFQIPPKPVYDLFKNRKELAPTRLYFCKGAAFQGSLEKDPERYRQIVSDFLDEDFHLKDFSKLL